MKRGGLDILESDCIELRGDFLYIDGVQVVRNTPASNVLSLKIGLPDPMSQMILLTGCMVKETLLDFDGTILQRVLSDQSPTRLGDRLWKVTVVKRQDAIWRQ